MYLTKRQKQILDYLKEYIKSNGYSPTYNEIREYLKLSSLATVHKHITGLLKKGLISKDWNKSRSVTIIPDYSAGRSVEIPILGQIAAGYPVHAYENKDVIIIPDEFSGRKETFALRVSGDSMIEEHIVDGDIVIVEKNNSPFNGDTVVALIENQEVTLKKFFKEGSIIRLQPGNPEIKPIYVAEEKITIQGIVRGVIRKYSQYR